jgi:uncharacterized protein YoxC
MEYTISDLSLLAIAIAFIALVVLQTRLNKKLHLSLMNMDDTLSEGKLILEQSAQGFGNTLKSFEELESVTSETLKGIQQRISIVDEQIIPLFLDLQKAAQTYDALGRELHSLSVNVNEKMKTTESLFVAVKDAGDTVKDVTDITRPAIYELAVQVSSMAKGIKAALEVISNNLLIKGGKTNELQ